MSATQCETTEPNKLVYSTTYNNIVSIKYWVIEIWTALNLSCLRLRLSGSICVGWLRLAQQYEKDV